MTVTLGSICERSPRMFKFNRSSVPILRVCGAVLGVFLLALPARANDDQLIFGEFTSVVYGTRTYNNGWQDGGWVPLYPTNNPVHSGTNSLCLAPDGAWEALHFFTTRGHLPLHQPDVLDQWRATGGQAVPVRASLGGAEQ